MPPSSSPVLDAERRAWNYWFVDGLPNLLAGLSCLLLSGTFLLVTRYRHTRSLLVIAIVVLAFGIHGVVFFRLRQMLEWLKARITYPRTGYAASPYFTFWQDAQPTADLTMLNLGKVEKPGILPSAQEAAREVEDRHSRLWLTLGTYLVALLCGVLIRALWVCGALGIAGGGGNLADHAEE